MVKKLSSLLVAIAIIFSITLVGYAAPNISAINEGVFIASLSVDKDNFQPGAVMTYVDGDYTPGDMINIYLNPDKFTGTDLNFTPENGMSMRTLENAGVTLRTSGGKNSNLIASISFKEATLEDKPVAFIQVALVKNFNETTDKDFETTITLLLNRERTQSITVGGTLSNDKKTVDEEDHYIFLGDGSVVEATTAIREIEVDTGNNVSLFARMYEGRSYYAVSSLTPNHEDIALMEKYPEIELTVTLNTTGFENSSPQVKLGLEEDFYAYSTTGVYLGKTSERLDFSEKYYLASSKVEIDTGSSAGSSTEEDSSTSSDDSSSTPTTEPEDTTGSSDGGGNGNVYVGGDSDIPFTGVGPGLKIAVGAGIVSVLVLLILFLTRNKGKGKHDDWDEY